MKRYYKFLGPKGEAPYGVGSWNLPSKGKPGKWMPHLEDIHMCFKGYHVCEKKDLLEWLRPDCWVVEVKGTSIVGDNKSVFSDGRLLKKTKLNEQTLRLFAADCAERALKYASVDTKSKLKDIIAVTRAYAFGIVSKDILYAWRNKAWNIYCIATADADFADVAIAAAADAAYARAAYARAAYARAAYAVECKRQTNRLYLYLEGKVDLKAMKKKVKMTYNKLKENHGA